MTDRGIRPEQLPPILGVKRDKALELRRRDDFPRPRRIPGSQSIIYLESEIVAWLHNLEKVA